MSKTYCECILHHFRGVTKMVINIDSLGFTANAYDDADASLPALLLLLTIEILTSLLHFIHQLLRRRKIKLILCPIELRTHAFVISGPSQGPITKIRK